MYVPDIVIDPWSLEFLCIILPSVTSVRVMVLASWLGEIEGEMLGDSDGLNETLGDWLRLILGESDGLRLGLIDTLGDWLGERLGLSERLKLGEVDEPPPPTG